MRALIVAFAAVSMSACSWIGLGEDEPPAAPVRSLELYLSRGHSKGSDFEQFKLTGDTLYKECGPIKRGRQYVREQDVVTVPPELRPRIDRAASSVIESRASGDTLAKPGSNVGVFGKGQLLLKVRSDAGTAEVNTTLDSVSEPEGIEQIKIRELASLVRTAAGLPLCDATQFYGIQPVK